MSSPFIVGKVIKDPNKFWGRKREVAEIWDRLQKMGSLSIMGERRIGKSSLAYYVYLIGKKDFGKDYEFIWLDGQSNHAASIALFCQAIATRSSLPYQAGEDKRTCLLNFEDAVENHAKRLVIILNEFERLVDTNVQTAFDETFFSTLR